MNVGCLQIWSSIAEYHLVPSFPTVRVEVKVCKDGYDNLNKFVVDCEKNLLLLIDLLTLLELEGS
jgi:hypothetical protein